MFLDSTFLSGPPPADAEGGNYNLALVLLSYCVASFGSYTGLTMASRLSEAKTRNAQNLLLTGGAFALGSGIWSMHFIGMLAYRMKMAVSYDFGLTLLSMAIAIGIAYSVLAMTRSDRLTLFKLVAGALLLGTAICAMHYTGMAAMQMDASLRYQPLLFALSFFIAVVASGAALGIIFYLGGDRRPHKILWDMIDTRRLVAALVMGAAICGMHYTGMAAAVMVPFANCRYAPDQDFSLLALAIAIVTGVVFAIALTMALYAKEREKLKENEAHRFPIKLLVATFLFTFVTVMTGTGSGLYVNFVLRNEIQRDIKFNERGNQIAYLKDDILRATQMIVTTGDPKWHELYDKDGELLDSAIQEVKDSSPNGAMRDVANTIDSMSILLEDMEKKSFDLAQQGKTAEAQTIINSEAYTTIQQNFSKNILALSLTANELFSRSMTDFNGKVSYGVYVSLLILVTLPITWLFAFRAVRQWRLEMELTRKNLAARESELQRYIGEIETSQTAALKAQKKAEEEAQRAEQATAAKSDFLANMSHEIRTPMNGLLGMSRLLLGTEMNAEQRNWTEIIYNSGENLLNIINDILDFSKIEANRLKLESAVFDLNAAMADVTDMVVLRTQEKNIGLFVRIAPGTPRYLVGDASRLKQVALNLLSNAVKFTMQGYVLLDIRGEAASDTDVRLHVRIEDTGIGISKDKIDYVFEKFSQAEESTTRRFGGTGLGLAISRRLVSLMDGDIAVESVVGEGSVFSFSISLPKPAQAPANGIPPAKIRGLRVLVVCDSKMKIGIISEYLEHWGMLAQFCSTPDDVLPRLREAAAKNEPFQFVYLDRNASVDKVMELVDRVRIFPELKDTLFTVTATLGSAIASRVLNSSQIAALLTKPLYPDQLQSAFKILWDAKENERKIGLVTRGLISRLQNNITEKNDVSASFHGIKILAVEDMKVNQILMAKILEKLGCHTEFATNGQEAVDKVANANFDAVFMDCQMPVMDGFEATKKIRENELSNGRHTTVIALTADAMTGDREKCMNAGMDDYLNKPFKPEQITDMLKKWVARG